MATFFVSCTISAETLTHALPNGLRPVGFSEGPLECAVAQFTVKVGDTFRARIIHLLSSVVGSRSTSMGLLRSFYLEGASGTISWENTDSIVQWRKVIPGEVRSIQFSIVDDEGKRPRLRWGIAHVVLAFRVDPMWVAPCDDEPKSQCP